MTDETKRIGDYQILDELGSGGMGRVWRVRNVISDRIEAMKVLLPDLAGRQELAARFLREIKLMASLNHPNIAALRTAFTADNQLYMVMEYVEGITMAEKLEHGAIPVSDALNYIGQVLSAVSYAHQQKVIHRDIKPANMMLTPQGVIKLMDFGIARPGELHPGLPAELNEIILMAIAKDPAQRFQSADAFRNALSSVPITASPVVSQSALDAPTVTSMQTPAVLPAAPAAKPPAPVSASVSTLKDAKSTVPSSAPVPIPPLAQSGGHRGLYMTLGALIVLAGLVVAGIYVPRSNWTHAKSPEASTTAAAPQNPVEPTPASQTATNQNPDMASQSAAPSTPSAGSAASTMISSSMPPPAAPRAATASVDNSNAMAKSNSAHLHANAKKLMAQNNGMASQAPASAQSEEGAASSGAAASSAQLDELEKSVDQLSNRAAAVNSSLDRLQQQQAASGYGLRGDMVERQASLKSNLYKAEEALQHRDVARAKKYADLAEADAGVLERFLGH